MAKYKPLSEEAQRLKRQLSGCVQYAEWIGNLEEERRDMEALHLPEAEILAKRLQELRTDWERKRGEAAALITQTEELNSLERRILRLRYLAAAPWDCICATVHRESSVVYTAYRSALNKLAKQEAA